MISGQGCPVQDRPGVRYAELSSARVTTRVAGRHGAGPAVQERVPVVRCASPSRLSASPSQPSQARPARGVSVSAKPGGSRGLSVSAKPGAERPSLLRGQSLGPCEPAELARAPAAVVAEQIYATATRQTSPSAGVLRVECRPGGRGERLPSLHRCGADGAPHRHLARGYSPQRPKQAIPVDVEAARKQLPVNVEVLRQGSLAAPPTPAKEPVPVEVIKRGSINVPLKQSVAAPAHVQKSGSILAPSQQDMETRQLLNVPSQQDLEGRKDVGVGPVQVEVRVVRSSKYARDSSPSTPKRSSVCSTPASTLEGSRASQSSYDDCWTQGDMHPAVHRHLQEQRPAPDLSETQEITPIRILNACQGGDVSTSDCLAEASTAGCSPESPVFTSTTLPESLADEKGHARCVSPCPLAPGLGGASPVCASPMPGCASPMPASPMPEHGLGRGGNVFNEEAVERALLQGRGSIFNEEGRGSIFNEEMVERALARGSVFSEPDRALNGTLGGTLGRSRHGPRSLPVVMLPVLKDPVTGPFIQDTIGLNLVLCDRGYRICRQCGTRESVAVGSCPLQRGARGLYFEVKVLQTIEGWIGGLGIGVTLTRALDLQRIPDKAWRIPSTFVVGYSGCAHLNGKEHRCEWQPDTLTAGQCVGCLITGDGREDMVIFVDGRRVFQMDGVSLRSNGWRHEPLYPVVDVFNATLSVELLPNALAPEES